jgi:nucleoside-diphosphate-sugar epimerase
LAPPGSIKKVLITGVYGLIGNLVYQRLAAQPNQYDVYGSSRRPQPSARTEGLTVEAIPPERLHLADIADFDSVRRAVEGMDTVVHMAADPSGEGGWDSLLRNNIIGAHNIFEASRQAGVQRVLYASTNQVVFGYHGQEFIDRLYSPDKPAAFQIPPIDHTRPARPLNEYASSKVFGEALAHMYAFARGLSCIVLRIGWVLADDTPPSPRAQTLWCSQRDCVQLVERCINAPADLRFDIFFVQSDNADNMVDIQHAKDVLGYAPQDRAG